MNCIFCENEIKEGAEVINPKTIKDGDVLIRKMIVNEKKKVYAHALCFEITKKKNLSLLQFANAREQSDNNDSIINQKMTGFTT